MEEYTRIRGFAAGFEFGYVTGYNDIPYNYHMGDAYIKTHHRFECSNFKWHFKDGLRAGIVQGSYDKLIQKEGVTELKWHMYKRQFINETESIPAVYDYHIELDYYDGPLLMWANKDENHQFIIANLSRTRNFDHWLYIPVTAEGVAKLQSGEWSFGDAKRATADRLYVVREDHYAAKATLEQLPEFLDFEGDDFYLTDKDWTDRHNPTATKTENLISQLNQFIANGDIKVQMEGNAHGYEWVNIPSLVYTTNTGHERTITIGRAIDWL